ncbi:50S ribosomal protein L23 [candidate division CPR3 bacterium 4484_211]|uniref:Large ribosomal subunit protein uL23 n=1 Tax=candidate division CPR3 bacterium 4484_211 TaxID=1968527 RepID=A0A1W9NZH0_UNCC3|nr:MAG: 50S ribosomal protein L23 [candidate division CPR3 bacterium 4484_211]
MQINQIIKRPVVTEKSTSRVALNQYTFEVDKKATKRDIAAAVEQLFNVEVYRVRVINRRGHSRRVGKLRLKKMSPSKRFAVVTINPKQKIDVFEVESKG